MRIALFYEDAFEPGGAPVGIRNLAQALSARHDVALWGKAYAADYPALETVRCRRYRTLRSLLHQLPTWIDEDRPDVVIIVGFFLSANMPVAHFARKRGVPVLLHPLAQVWDVMLRGKVFTQGCDVRLLENAEENSDHLLQRLADRLSPHKKKLYLNTLGRRLVRLSNRIVVLSSEEQRQFNTIYPRPPEDFITMPWGIDALTGLDDDRHFFREVLGCADNTPNLIVWSRLDWYYKGLDRLLAGVRQVRERLGPAALPFRLFLCGPDYRGGAGQAARFAQKHGLEDLVYVLLPGRYEPGSLTPLRDADASLLLSPWDGSPRALRESIFLGTPILVSRETNFGEIVEESEAGLLVGDADDAGAVADALLALADRQHLAHLRQNTRALAARLAWSEVADRLTQTLQRDAGLFQPAAGVRSTPRPLSKAPDRDALPVTP